MMIMGAFIPGLRRRYSLLEYVSAIMLVLGLVAFTLADAQTSPNFSIMGVVMVVGALVLDAFVGNLQEVIFTINPATTQARLVIISFLSFLSTHGNFNPRVVIFGTESRIAFCLLYW